ncbi:hypothetical protein J6590_082957 [Homalodisca vitripennis]|nr:hypothetical protein J6590_082957 [Homalodisca vitripennis]
MCPHVSAANHPYLEAVDVNAVDDRPTGPEEPRTSAIAAGSQYSSVFNSTLNLKRFCLDSLENDYVKTVKGIRGMQWLRFTKSDPFTLLYKTTFNEDTPFSEYNMKPNVKPGRRSQDLASELQSKPNVPGIKPNKYKDFKDLLTFIPPCHHAFYTDLPSLCDSVRSGQQLPRQTEPNDDVVEEEDLILGSYSD